MHPMAVRGSKDRRAKGGARLVPLIYCSIGGALAAGALIYLPYAATHGWLRTPTRLEFWLEFAMPAAIYLAIGIALWMRLLRRR